MQIRHLCCNKTNQIEWYIKSDSVPWRWLENWGSCVSSVCVSTCVKLALPKVTTNLAFILLERFQACRHLYRLYLACFIKHLARRRPKCCKLPAALPALCQLHRNFELSFLPTPLLFFYIFLLVSVTSSIEKKGGKNEIRGIRSTGIHFQTITANAMGANTHYVNIRSTKPIQLMFINTEFKN